MTLEQLKKIQDAICDTHKCGPNCPNRRAKINNWDGCAFCLTVYRYPDYEDWLKRHPIILKKALDRIKEKKMNFNEFLPKELVRKLSGLFMLEENCRGYNPNTPIGEIAEHAF